MMTECEGDFKCPYCKGDTPGLEKPTDLQGACRESELNDRLIGEFLSLIAELEEELDQALVDVSGQTDRAVVAEYKLAAVRACPEYAVEADGYSGWKIVPAEGYEAETFIKVSDRDAALAQGEQE